MIRQSMAREHGSKGSHLAHILIDWHQWRAPGEPTSDGAAQCGQGGLLEIDVIAEAAVLISGQPAP
jgi:hypothetical protein